MIVGFEYTEAKLADVFISGTNTSLGDGINYDGSGTNNSLFGYTAGASISSGSSITCLGSGSGAAITSGSSLTVVGSGAAAAMTTGNYATAVGNAAGAQATANSWVAVGIESGTLAAAGTTTVGSWAGRFGGTGHASFGYYASAYSTGVNASVFGYEAGKGVSGSSNGTNNSFFGYRSGYAITTGSSNLAAGSGSFVAATTAGTSVVLGKGSAAAATTNGGLVCLGYMSGAYETAADKLFIDNQDRTNEATGRTNSLIYGVFNATPSSQQVTFNSDHQVRYKPVWIPSSTQTLADDAAVSSNAGIVRVAGDGGAATLDTDPAVSDGTYDGQLLIIQGTDDSNTVAIADACNTALAGDATATLGQGDTLTLIWNSGDSLWYEVSRSAN